MTEEDMPVADRSTYPDSSTDGDEGPDQGSPPKTPRWVKAFGVIVIVLVLLFVALHISGNSPFGGPGGHTPPSRTTGQGAQQP